RGGCPRAAPPPDPVPRPGVAHPRRGAPPGAGPGVVAHPKAPAGARAVIATITATDAAGPGFVTAWPCDRPRPTASSLNYGAGATVAGLTLLPPPADRSICLVPQAPAPLA